METYLKGRTAVITGASMGIGEAIAMSLAEKGMNVALLARSKDKLEAVKARIESKCHDIKVDAYSVDIQSHADVDAVVKRIVSALGDIEVLINNSMWPRKRGTIINVSSVTGLECPPFDGEAVYHANKACLEAFTNSLRMETAGSNIRVSVLRPGCVVSHFHLQRVKYDQNAMDEFFYGYEPLVPEDLADAVWYMVSCPERTTIKALDCVPTAQRALTRFDREWNARRGGDHQA
ncbi:hypothetical protein AbraIFM66951_004955 [Aspergillus brasiliensis]|uniref:Uncharacterized protein n=1 Tax=Aspergillus brasiliensis TaxID=319629 RepID=A0A9W5YUX4_9EURO|nr:hypothetical protein AbraCBS73388_009011 [Aspergillus brasiliensis]GKZ43589.1 hypothetical protein AbraIFM66951_004955 [Aspergillus brasiliensis]